MNISPRAANQLHALDHALVATILDRLRDLYIGPRSHIVEVTSGRSIVTGYS